MLFAQSRHFLKKIAIAIVKKSNKEWVENGQFIARRVYFKQLLKQHNR